ncbi:S-layer homology domain-containing protein, partial [Anaerotignum faecicola]
QVDNAVFWPLSIAEAHAVNQDLRIVNKEHTNWAMYHWWLRSPCKSSSSAAVVHGNGEVLDDGMYHTSDEFGVRPAFNLNLNAVLFASAAVGGKPDGGLTPISEYTGSEWKLTLLDNSRNFAVTEKAVSGDPDGTLTLHYSGATTGTNEYISVILADNSGAKYYGRVAQPTEATGTVEIKIPSDIAPGSYTLKVFSEQYNGDHKTDYASDFTDIALTVGKQMDEQFNLDPDGTYYFDLSGESIPSTVNDSLPDKTMHYVPFTYAGTVDAYTLTSERETTEEYAQKNKYLHSLFVADYAVKHTVSWNDLHTEGLIFGKDYVAGGVGYTLRAPSVGSDRTGLNESQRGTPQSNEWDKMLDKNDGYIKNWKRMASWGQDTRPDNSTPFRAVRGFHSARGWEFNSSSYQNGILGFRPVLEVLNPDALDADGLKAVTLALGGGKLGGSAEDIQIIVKNGESFTAPASDGLTRPDRNTENYFKWLGSDGNLYAPGESVSADVTKLTAKFAGGSSGSGGGGSSRKPSVTYYTLHFETNGGSAITDMREENNTRISLTKYVPTRHGYTFIGWYSDHNLTNQVSEVSLTKNMTVYAGWRADENPDIVVNPFTDVSEKDWFYNDAMFVYKNGLMLGTSKTLFSPHGTVTRGMMATILWRMEGSLAPKGENSFTDVEAGRWYADAITWTTENGIFAGYSKDKFGPDDPITREQLTAIFYRYADYKGYKLTVTENLDKFEDADKITDYAKMVMQWAVGNGLIKGKSENLLDPQGTATRAEIAAMLHRFIEKVKPMQAD